MKRALAPFVEGRGFAPHEGAGYRGPWIENHWASWARSRTGCLADSFGPYIPLILPWTDLWEPERSLLSTLFLDFFFRTLIILITFYDSC